MHLTLTRSLLCMVAAGSLVLAGCSSTPQQGSRPPTQTGAGSAGISAVPQPTIPARLTQDQANDVTLYAISLVGTPYRYGGNTPESGFDCSGLIGHVYKSRAGVLSPRTVAALSSWGQPVPAQAVRTGDLVVFTQKGVTNHAGIYVGEGRFVHAPSTGGTVRLDALHSTYWSRQGVSYRRP